MLGEPSVLSVRSVAMSLPSHQDERGLGKSVDTDRTDRTDSTDGSVGRRTPSRHEPGREWGTASGCQNWHPEAVSTFSHVLSAVFGFLRGHPSAERTVRQP